MEMSMFLIVILVCVAVFSVSGQFVDTDYRPDNIPLPIRRRVNSGQFEIKPSIGGEIQISTESTRTLNQGRRHIENDHRGNVHNAQINRNIDNLNINPSENIYQTDDRNYETIPADRPANNNGQQKYSENQFGSRSPVQNEENYNRETNIQKNYKNFENQSQRNYGDAILKTNLDNPRNTQGNLHLQTNHQLGQQLKTNANSANQQNHRVYENSRESGPATGSNTKNFDRTYQNEGNQPNYESAGNAQINGNPINPQDERTYDNNQDINNSRHADASMRAIASNSYGKQGINPTSNNRNHNIKPDPETTNNNNKNYEAQTEPTRRITDDRTVTAGTKSTEDNELVSRHPEGRMGNNDDDKWIWSNDGGKTTKSTISPTNPTVDDRAAFSGDKCPTGQVRFNNMCVDID